MIRSILTRRVAGLAATLALASGVLAAVAVSAQPPAAGPVGTRCVSTASLACPALRYPPLPAGQWYELSDAVSGVLPVSACDDGSHTWMPVHLTLTAMLPDGHENVSAFDDWCVPTDDLTAAGTGLPWSALFDAVAVQAN
jgi:hypothetical protein